MKPLEKKNNWLIIVKILFLSGLVVSAVVIDKVFLKKKDVPSVLGITQERKQQIQKNDLINDSIKKAGEVGGGVLGDATNTFNKLTSDAKSFVSNAIYNNSIGKVVEQIDKLPKDQQEKIKERICK